MEIIRDLLHIDHEVARQRRDGDEDQELYRQPMGLEIDADHGTELEIDE